MRRFGTFGRRISSLLLAILMVVQLLPVGVLAAKGDIVSSEDIGFDPDTLNGKVGINWPIKIYDYLNDGMLFEPANSRADATDAEVKGMVYGGGWVMPATTAGTDYTTAAGTSSRAYSWSISQKARSNYALSMVAAKRFESPKYMHVAYPGAGSYKYHMLHSFIVGSGGTSLPEVGKANMRYMVFVYRANGRDSDERIDIQLEHNNNGSYEYRGYADADRVGLQIQDTREWTALVVDLAEALGESRWNSVTTVAGVYMLSDMADSGDYIDISHVAFFADPQEARYYGEDAVAFDNDPGEHLEVAQTITLGAGSGVPTYYTYPSASEPGWNFSPSSSNVPTASNLSSSTTKNRFGLNFALGTGQTTQTYKYWSTGREVTIKYSNGTTQKLVSDAINVTNTDDGNRDHVTLSNTASSSNIILTEFAEGAAGGTTLGNGYDRVPYMVIVYRADGYSTSEQMKFWLAGYNYSSPIVGCNGQAWLQGYPAGTAATNFKEAYYDTNILVEDGWVSVVVNLKNIINTTYVKYVGMNFPTGSGKSLDLAYVGYFPDQAGANTFATNAVAYMNQGIKVQTGVSGATTATLKAGRTWNLGNNLAYGLLFGCDGPGWTSLAGGNKTDPNGYYAYAIGYDVRKGHDTATGTINKYRKDFNGDLYSSTGGSNGIYLLKAQDMADYSTLGRYDMSALQFDGYQLLQTVTSGWLTAGMLESGLVDGRPVYRQETVEYLANLLYETLIIPPFDSDGDYNYNFVKGEKSSQFAFDINGDGDLEDRFDLTGDAHPETREASMDLATALRICLGVKFTFGMDKGAYEKGSAVRGSYADTLTRADKLTGEFSSARSSITTCVDAAYYMLNSLFQAGSFNQLQDDYDYLTLSSAVLSDGREAYVFDAGYTTGSGDVTAAGYQSNSKSALVYSPKVAEVDGELVHGKGTISLGGVMSKDMISLSNDNGYTTTRFPFLPVTDTEGDYPPDTESAYFADDGVLDDSGVGGSYKGRNFNYVMSANGEFVYYEDDSLFFEFEGDDDVYLFINGQLVLDIGGAHGITKAKIDVNTYVAAARAEVEQKGEAASNRAKALALTEGEVCQFDFYYMERHGYGANCRIVTNMHVTDPVLGADKTAHQGDVSVEYGGVVDPASPIGYEFKLINTGNTKLYNLTFSDPVIGVTLDPENGLTIDSALAGAHVLNIAGQPLQCTDLSAVVEGYNAQGQYLSHTITFADEQALKNFLATLDAEGLESGQDDSEVTRAGSGLWVDASVTIKGIYYKMTAAQVKAGVLNNTVELSATTKIDPSNAASQILRSSDTHRVYTAGAPVYYQWAGHPLFVTYQDLLEDSIREAGSDNSQLSQYREFFNAVGNDLSKVHIRLSDKDGKPVAYAEVREKTYGSTGYEIDYRTPETKTFFAVMHMKEYAAGTAISAMEAGKYAIIRVTVYVADVEDSVFVLDYGLRTESLDVGGELFKNDHLFGGAGSMQAKLMGVSTTQPFYLSAADGIAASKYNRIAFEKYTLGDDKNVVFEDGYFKVNVAIGEDGKEITYDAVDGHYSLTDVGTVRLNAEVPVDWANAYVYYWYGGGRDNEWPGDPMVKLSSGIYYLDIPADVSNVIISDGTSDQQTQNLTLTPGLESTVQVSRGSDGTIKAYCTNVAEYTTVHVTSVPSGWGEVWLHGWRDDGAFGEEGFDVQMQLVDGVYTAQLPGDASFLTVTNGTGNRKQSVDLDIYAGQEVWIALDGKPDHTNENGDECYKATLSYSQSNYTVHVKVPSTWKTAYLYCWNTGIDYQPAPWPGQQMTKDEDGWYSLSVPAEISYMVINCGPDATDNVPMKTKDLTVYAGLETWITVDETPSGKDGTQDVYGASVDYGADAGITFVPTDIMDGTYEMWLGLTVHTAGLDEISALKGASVDGTIDINNEVQMYKKVTVLPATVVYYEDDFKGIHYTDKTGDGFTHHGKGSGSLTQSVDPQQIYGQDDAYQTGDNALYSGNSLSCFKITDTDDVASFAFRGTGFELISRTNAKDAATLVVKVFPAKVVDGTSIKDGEAIHEFPVINEFDNGMDGGEEAIGQVPVVRIRDLSYGSYIVEIAGSPEYDWDNWDGSVDENGMPILGMLDTYLYIDGLRIYQPLDASNEYYDDDEDGADFWELRDQIAGGLVAVGELKDGKLELSSGTTTWTEDLLGGDSSDRFVGNKVDSTDDYLIQGPNNEVYMEGTITNSALVFYVSEDATAVDHSLQLAVRGLDQERFYGVGNSPLRAQLQYGVKLSDGTYAWKALTTVVSGTEQYHSIPYTECPKQDGKYQVVIRVVAPSTGDLAMVSFSTLKTVGMELVDMGVGESSVVYYKDGVLIRPDYYLCSQSGEASEGYRFVDGKLTVTFQEDTLVYVKQIVDETFNGEDDGTVTIYRPDGQVDATSATMLPGNSGGMMIPGGVEVEFTLEQRVQTSLTLSYAQTCAHETWDEGRVVTEVSCTANGLTVYTCTCGMEREEITPALGHDYVGGLCSRCGSRDEHVEYYLFGYINGADYACEGDSATIGIYRFQDGSLTTSFNSESYVAVKTGDNQGWYMTDGYPGNGVTSAVLYNTSKGIDTNKLQVPGGVEVTFTLVVNEDDTMVLSYTTNNSTCRHLKHGTDGKCVVCGTEVGHSYSGGNCTGCGAVDPDTIVSYSLIGWINGADYGTGDDWQNPGQYRFVDGRLTAKFDQNSYIAVKTTDNSRWYWAPQYISATTGTFYQGDYYEKMFVPGGVTVYFTLVENSDGSVTVSYTTGTRAMALDLSSVEAQMASDVLVGAPISSEVPEPEPVTQPKLELSYPSLSFEDEILYNIYFTATELSDVVQMGLLTFHDRATDGTIQDAVDIIPGYVGSDGLYMVQSHGIPAAQMGDTLFFKVYAQLSDGSYAYSDVVGYNACAYAKTVLDREGSSDEMKALVVAMLEYGAEAQKFFHYNEDSLMDSFLSREQKALVRTYDEDLVDPVIVADSGKTAAFPKTAAVFDELFASVSFDGAFSINYYVTPNVAVDGEITFYYWDYATYASAEALTVENAIGSVTMTATGLGEQHWACIPGIAAKQIDETFYAAAVLQSEGVTYTSGVISYSLGSYCQGIAAKDGSEQCAFAMATAVYGYHAKAYFDTI